MNTRHASSQRLDASVAADVRVRRPASRGTEVYGSETLPVLIHLPDLTRSTVEQPATAYPRAEPRHDDWRQPEEPDARTAATDDDSESLLTDTVAAVADASLQTETEPLTRTPLRMRRRMQMQQTDGWLSGLRRFLVATIIAGVLFAVIVTIKEWNQTPASPPPHTTMAVEAIHVDLGPPELNAAGILPFDDHPALLRPDSEQSLGNDAIPRPIDPREINTRVSSGEFSVDAPPISPPSSNAFGSFEGVSEREPMRAAPGTAAGVVDGVVGGMVDGAVDGAAPPAGFATGYPSTGVDGLPGQPVGSAAWPRGTVPPQPVWNAERAPADGRFAPR